MRALALPLALVLAIVIVGCEDDGTSPGAPAGPEWARVDLPAEVATATISDFALGGSRALALAPAQDSAWVLERGAEGWSALAAGALPAVQRTDGPEGPRKAVTRDLSVDGGGVAHVVGFESFTESPFIWSETPTGWTVTDGSAASGELFASTADAAGRLVAAGRGNLTTRGQSPMATGSADAGIEFGEVELGCCADLVLVQDLHCDGTDVFAAGARQPVDQAANAVEPAVLRRDGDSWAALPAPCTECGDLSLMAVVSSGDAVYAGGCLRTGDAAVGDEQWLGVWRPGQTDWTRIALPEAAVPGELRDLAVADDGAVFVAGVGDVATLVRIPVDGEPTLEWSAPGTVLWGLGVLADGTVVAGGTDLSGATPAPLILERR